MVLLAEVTTFTFDSVFSFPRSSVSGLIPQSVNLNYKQNAELMVTTELNLLEMQQNGKERPFVRATVQSSSQSQ